MWCYSTNQTAAAAAAAAATPPSFNIDSGFTIVLSSLCVISHVTFGWSSCALPQTLNFLCSFFFFLPTFCSPPVCPMVIMDVSRIQSDFDSMAKLREMERINCRGTNIESYRRRHQHSLCFWDLLGYCQSHVASRDWHDWIPARIFIFIFYSLLFFWKNNFFIF